MARAVHRALVRLSDPTAADAPAPRLRPGQTRRLLQLADHHGVLPAVLARLRGSGVAAEATASAEQRLMFRAALALELRARLAAVADALAARGVRAVLFKGPDFADRLYARQPGLRLFNDLDLLIGQADRESAERAMRDAGFAPLDPHLKHAGDYGEQGWMIGRANVEVHWDLVNSPALRRAVSVRLEDLRTEERPGPGGLLRPDPASMLLGAAVHAATGHGFDRLSQLWDIRLLVGGSAGPLDEAWLAEAVERTGGRQAMALALDLCERALGERSCGELAGRLGLKRPGACLRLLISPAVVLRGHARVDSLRRQLLRELLKRGRGRRDANPSSAARSPEARGK